MSFCAASQLGSLATASHILVASASTQFPYSSAKFVHSPALSWASLRFASQRRITRTTFSPLPISNTMDGLFSKLGFGRSAAVSKSDTAGASIAQGPDDDVPAPGQQFVQFGAGCFWGVELAFQRVPGVTKTEAGYSQGFLHNPTYEDVCSGSTMHSEVVRVQYDPNECSYDSLLDTFWARHDPTTPNRQGNDVGTQYRSGIYFYTPEQERAAYESLEKQQQKLSNKIVTEILPAKKFYRAEEYHQQYLEKGGRFGFKQSTAKGCNDPIRCYG